MKKFLCLIFALTVLLTACAAPTASEPVPTEYVHTPYVSAVSAEDCFVCGKDAPTQMYWGEDNVGILCLRTFQVFRLEINRYLFGEWIQEPSGVMLSGGMQCGDTYVHAYTDPDRGHAHVYIKGQHPPIDTEAIQNHLCQACLDQINDMYFGGCPPKAYAIINFSDKTIRPLLRHSPFFGSGNYGIDCEFEENGDMDLLIIYCPPRFPSLAGGD